MNISAKHNRIKAIQAVVFDIGGCWRGGSFGTIPKQEVHKSIAEMMGVSAQAGSLDVILKATGFPTRT